MQRLALAIIIVAILVVLLAVFVAGLRATLAERYAEADRGDPASGLQKVAYALLIALVGYVAIAGPD